MKRNVYVHGRTKETFKKFKLHPSKDKRGYLVVNLYDGYGRKQRKVHNIVANAFLENPLKLRCVCHKDNNKENCNVNNLYWGTDKENNEQARADGLFHNEIKVGQFDLNGKLLFEYRSISEAVRKTNIKNIQKCVCGERKTAGGYKWRKLD